MATHRKGRPSVGSSPAFWGVRESTHRPWQRVVFGVHRPSLVAFGFGVCCIGEVGSARCGGSRSCCPSFKERHVALGRLTQAANHRMVGGRRHSLASGGEKERGGTSTPGLLRAGGGSLGRAFASELRTHQGLGRYALAFQPMACGCSCSSEYLR